MTDDFDGTDLLDGAGEKVGSVERTYVDDDGQARFLGVKRGTLRSTHQLVPTDGMQQTEDGIQVPYSKDTIEGSPAIDAGDTLEGDTLTRVRAHYANPGGDDADNDETDNSHDDADDDSSVSDKRLVSPIPTDPAVVTAVGEVDQRNRPANDIPASDASESGGEDRGTLTHVGEVRDLGDVLEIPIVEEVLDRKPVVREVLRVRKISGPVTYSGFRFWSASRSV